MSSEIIKVILTETEDYKIWSNWEIKCCLPSSHLRIDHRTKPLNLGILTLVIYEKLSDSIRLPFNINKGLYQHFHSWNSQLLKFSYEIVNSLFLLNSTIVSSLRKLYSIVDIFYWLIISLLQTSQHFWKSRDHYSL